MMTTRFVMLTSVLVAAMAYWPAIADDQTAPVRKDEAAGLFHVEAVATEVSPFYEVWLEHDGLAWPDGRAIQVLAPGSQPVRHFVSYADESRARVVFDGRQGTGAYRVRFGDLSDQTPVDPHHGLVLVDGGYDWQPKGGYSCVSYRPEKPVEEYKTDMMSPEAMRKVFAAAQAYAEAAEAKRLAEKARIDALPDDAEEKKAYQPKPPYVVREVYPSAARINLPVFQAHPYGGYLHVFRAVIGADKPESYHFRFGRGDGFSANLKVLFANQNYTEPVIRGWYKAFYGISVAYGEGSVSLPAGRNVLELYTNLEDPKGQVRIGSEQATLQWLDGRLAHFDACRRLEPGPVQAGRGDLAEAYRTMIDHRIRRGEFTVAKRLIDVAAKRFAHREDVAGSLRSLVARVDRIRSSKLWPTEGKDAARTGFVPDATFVPPLREAFREPAVNFHDPVGLSGAVWSERGLIYGLPFQVLPESWGVTSGICLGEDTLYVGLKTGQMLAVNATSGELRWSFPGEGSCLGTPLLHGQTLYYGAIDRRLYALDARRGRMRWYFPAHRWIVASPAAMGANLYFAAADGHVYAVDAQLGVQRWAIKLDGRVTGAPTCSEGRVYLGTHEGVFYALDARTGQTVWTYEAAGPIAGGACIGHGLVCFGDSAGRVHALDVETGWLIWNEACDVGGPVRAAPILVDRVLYGGTSQGGKLWGIRLDDGKRCWTAEAPEGGSLHRPAVFGEGKLVFVLRASGHTTAGNFTRPAVVTYEMDVEAE